MNVKNWRFSFDIKQNILDSISLWGAIGLLWFSFISVIGEHFPTFLQVSVLVSKPQMDPMSVVGPENFEVIGMDWWVISLFVFLLWFGYDWPRKYLKKITAVCRWTGLAIPVIYMITKLTEVVDGMCYLANKYIPLINAYYKERIPSLPGGAEKNAVIAFTALSMLLWAVVWVLAYGWKKRIILVSFPIIGLALELFVGLSPIKEGLFFAFYAAILLLVLGGASVIKRIIAIACVCVCVIFTGYYFDANINELVTLDAKQSILRFQNNMKIENFNVFKLFQVDFHFDTETLNNNAPEYTGDVILEIETNRLPYSEVYLKGYYGTHYENGNWIYDDSAFEELCAKAGKSQQEVAKEIFQMPYDRFNALNNDTDQIMYKIYYTATTGDVAYLPYVTEYASADDEYSFLGDYLIKKSIWDKSVEISGINVVYTKAAWQLLWQCIAKGMGYKCFEDYYGVAIDLNGKTEDVEFLNSFAQSYLSVPDSADYLVNAIETIGQWTDEEEHKEYIATYGVNYERLSYANSVAAYLDRRMSYSLKLDNLPQGTDPIEYAMTKSYEGYCMHFASAATLMLRSLGVPARYVSGYTVAPSAFMWNPEEEIFEAEVTDYMAHAWVEIYLDYIGWVPFEVTPGSSLDSLPTTEDINRWESQSNANRQELIDMEIIDDPEDTSDSTEDLGNETETSESEETEEPTSETEGNNRPQNNNKQPNGGISKETIAVIWKGIAVVLAVLGILFVLRSSNKRFENVLEKEVENKMTRKAVRRINRRIYNKLRLRIVGGWFGKNWTDVEYKKALIENFSQVNAMEWEKYMDIVKKNHYSNEDTSVEEMEYCYSCYKKVKEKK